MNKRKLSNKTFKENQAPTQTVKRFKCGLNEDNPEQFKFRVEKNQSTCIEETKNLTSKPVVTDYSTNHITSFQQERQVTTKNEKLMNLLLKSKYIDSEQVIENNCFKTTPHLCISFIDLIHIATLSENEENYNSWKEFICSSLKPNDFKQLLEEIVKIYYNKDFKFSSLILDLIEIRVKFLDEHIPAKIKFSWHMSCPNISNIKLGLREKTTISKNVESLENFFRSNQTQMTLKGGMSLAYVNKFCKQCGGLHGGYSVAMKVVREGNEAALKLTKTKEYHRMKSDIEANKAKENKAELQVLRDFLGIQNYLLI